MREKLKNLWLWTGAIATTMLMTGAAAFAGDDTDIIADEIGQGIDSAQKVVGKGIQFGMGLFYLFLIVGIPIIAFFGSKKKAMQSGSDHPELIAAVWAVGGLLAGAVLAGVISAYFSNKGIPLTMTDVITSMVAGGSTP